MRHSASCYILCLTLSGCAADISKPAPVAPAQPAEPPLRIAVAGQAGVQSVSASTLGVKLMTQDEVRTCASTLATVIDNTEAFRNRDQTLKRDREQLANIDKQLETDKAKVNMTSAKQVNAWNARLQQLHEDIRRFNARVNDYNAAVLASNQLNNRFNLGCAERPYRVDDLDILSEKERKALESGAKAFDLPTYSDDPGGNPSWLSP